MTLGEKIVKLRKINGLSQDKLGEIIGVSRQAISKWELNTAVPDTDNLVKMSKYFQVPIDFFVLEGNSTTVEEKSEEAYTGSLSLCYFFMIMGFVLVILSFVLAKVFQLKEQSLGSAYTNCIDYLVEFPLNLILLASAFSLVCSTIFIVKKRGKK